VRNNVFSKLLNFHIYKPKYIIAHRKILVNLVASEKNIQQLHSEGDINSRQGEVFVILFGI
jgi:hypothetical protein